MDEVQTEDQVLDEAARQQAAYLKAHILRLTHEVRQFMATRVENDTVFLNVALELAAQALTQSAQLYPEDMPKVRPVLEALFLMTADMTVKQ